MEGLKLPIDVFARPSVARPTSPRCSEGACWSRVRLRRPIPSSLGERWRRTLRASCTFRSSLTLGSLDRRGSEGTVWARASRTLLAFLGDARRSRHSFPLTPQLRRPGTVSHPISPLTLTSRPCQPLPSLKRDRTLTNLVHARAYSRQSQAFFPSPSPFPTCLSRHRDWPFIRLFRESDPIAPLARLEMACETVLCADRPSSLSSWLKGILERRVQKVGEGHLLSFHPRLVSHPFFPPFSSSCSRCSLLSCPLSSWPRPSLLPGSPLSSERPPLSPLVSSYHSPSFLNEA